jgi:hypothetical protein
MDRIREHYDMSHFAKVENGIVTQVIVADQDVIDSGMFGSGWVQTSYNTRGGIHYGQDGQPSGGVAMRKNYAGIGYNYDSTRDAFIAPQPYPSWTLVEQTCQWTAPTPMPVDDKRYTWDEATLAWVEMP